MCLQRGALALAATAMAAGLAVAPVPAYASSPAAAEGPTVELTSEPYAAAPGHRVAHTIVVRGADEDRAVVFTSTAPLTGIEAPGGDCAPDGTGVRCVFHLGRNPKDPAEFTVTGVVGAPADGLIRNSARLDGGAVSFNGYLAATAPAPSPSGSPEAATNAAPAAANRSDASPTQWSGTIAAALAVLWAAIAAYTGRRTERSRLLFGRTTIGGRP